MVRGKGYGVQHHFQQYFSYIVAVSFIGSGNRSTQRKPPTYRKSRTTFIPAKHCIEYTSSCLFDIDNPKNKIPLGYNVCAFIKKKTKQKKNIKILSVIVSNFNKFHSCLFVVFQIEVQHGGR